MNTKHYLMNAVSYLGLCIFVIVFAVIIVLAPQIAEMLGVYDPTERNYWESSDVPEHLSYFDGDEDSLHTFDRDDITVKDEDLLWDGMLTDNVLKVEVTDPWLVFREIPDPLMSYDVDKKHWTFSDRFLEDVADALVPVLKERGFAYDVGEER